MVDINSLMHYAEFYNSTTNELEWYRFKNGIDRAPSWVRYQAHKIILQDEDGSFRYIKNRTSGKFTVVPEQEMMWIILKAKDF